MGGWEKLGVLLLAISKKSIRLLTLINFKEMKMELLAVIPDERFEENMVDVC